MIDDTRVSLVVTRMGSHLGCHYFLPFSPSVWRGGYGGDLSRQRVAHSEQDGGARTALGSEAIARLPGEACGCGRQ